MMSIAGAGLQGQGGDKFWADAQARGGMLALCDYCLSVPRREKPRIQEAHILIGHTLSAMVEIAVFDDPGER